MTATRKMFTTLLLVSVVQLCIADSNNPMEIFDIVMANIEGEMNEKILTDKELDVAVKQLKNKLDSEISKFLNKTDLDDIILSASKKLLPTDIDLICKEKTFSNLTNYSALVGKICAEKTFNQLIVEFHKPLTISLHNGTIIQNDDQFKYFVDKYNNCKTIPVYYRYHCMATVYMHLARFVRRYSTIVTYTAEKDYAAKVPSYMEKCLPDEAKNIMNVNYIQYYICRGKQQN